MYIATNRSFCNIRLVLYFEEINEIARKKYHKNASRKNNNLAIIVTRVNVCCVI